MSTRSSWRRPARWVAVVGFLTFVALVIGRSLQVAGYRCTVCIDFGGRSACRTVEAASGSEARAGAINNACALLASGVTDTMACERTLPARDHCEALD